MGLRRELQPGALLTAGLISRSAIFMMVRVRLVVYSSAVSSVRACRTLHATILWHSFLCSFQCVFWHSLQQ